MLSSLYQSPFFLFSSISLYLSLTHSLSWEQINNRQRGKDVKSAQNIATDGRTLFNTLYFAANANKLYA